MNDKLRLIAFLTAISLYAAGMPVLNASAEDLSYGDEFVESTEFTAADIYYFDDEEEKTSGLHLKQDMPVSYYAQADAEAKELPASYDLREEGLVTSVKNQGNTETCWAHASLAAAESSLLKNDPDYSKTTASVNEGVLDFSEAHLVWFGQCTYSEDQNDPLYHKGNNLGIDGYMQPASLLRAAGLFSSWVGPAIPSYSNLPDVTEKSSIKESFRYIHSANLANAEFVSPSEITSIKKSLMKNGAVASSYYHNEDYYATNHVNYYYPESHNASHAITIVGWDDNYSKNNFVVKPSQDGAWLCKNSWGTEWGDNGYFWLSYYDNSIGIMASFQMETNSKYYTNYQYNNGVDYTDLLGYKSSGVATANLFTAKKSENINAVSFWTYTEDASYHVSVYKDVDTSAGDPTSGTLVFNAKVTKDHLGYYTLPLDEPFSVEKGSVFSVVVASDSVGQAAFSYDSAPAQANDCYFTAYDVKNATYGDWSKAVYENEPQAFAIKAFGVDGISINKENFPNYDLEFYAKNYADLDHNNVLAIDEIAKQTSITLGYGTPYKYARGLDYKGIEHFASLKELTLININIVALDLSQNTKLEKLTCTDCGVFNSELTSDYIASLPIDTSKIIEISGAQIIDGRIIPTSNNITYTYDCGNGFTAQFSIKGDTFVSELPADITPGDANGDAKVDIMDVILINKAIYGKTIFTDQQIQAADVNHSGAPDSTDSLTIMKYIIKLIDTLG